MEHWRLLMRCVSGTDTHKNVKLVCAGWQACSYMLWTPVNLPSCNNWLNNTVILPILSCHYNSAVTGQCSAMITMLLQHCSTINTIATLLQGYKATTIKIANKLVLSILFYPVPKTVNNRCCFINAEQHCWNNSQQHYWNNSQQHCSTMILPIVQPTML